MPHKAARNAKDLILKFCHSFRDTASPLAPNSRADSDGPLGYSAEQNVKLEKEGLVWKSTVVV